MPGFLLSQRGDTLRQREYSDQLVEQAIEDLITNNELEDQVDLSYLIDQLEAWTRRPLSLNEATQEELLLLPGMDEFLVLQFLAYQQRYGKLTSIYELQAIPGWTIEDIRPILPFVRVEESTSLDINPGVVHPSGPSLGEIVQGLEGELTQRFVQILEIQRGYTDPDTFFRPRVDDTGAEIGQDTFLNLRYLGDPLRSYTRLRFRYKRNLSIGVTGEKDPGEQFRWTPNERYYGYDFLSGHIFLQDFGRLKRLAIGDYYLQVGQGMILSRGLGFGKGAQVIKSVKQRQEGIRPYASVNENQFMRGAAATYALGNWHFTGFFSKLNLDASVQDRDTLTGEALLASSFQLSGFHRTLRELQNRRAIQETAYGGRVEYKTPTLTIGTTHLFQQFSGALDKTFNPYNQFDFRGAENIVQGVDVDWVVQNVNVFGEFARSQSGGIGATVGLMSSLSPSIDVSIVGRRFDKDFHSLKPYVFAERPTAAQNETGLYIGLRIAPNPKWTLSSYFDQYYFPWNKFRAYYPSNGWEFLTQLHYRPKRGTEVYARFRSDNKQINGQLLQEGEQLAYLIPSRKNYLRLNFRTEINRNIRYQTRIEGAWYKTPEEAHTGVLMYHDLIWKFGYKFKLTTRYALFDAPDYEARIYAYENDVLGFFTIPPYYNTGSRFYLIANWKISRELELWVRLAQTRLRDVCSEQRTAFATEIPNGPVYEQCSIGSGLQRIEGDSRTELKVQLRWRF